MGEWYFTIEGYYSIEKTIVMIGDWFNCLEEQELLTPSALFCDGPEHTRQTRIPMLEAFQPYSLDYWKRILKYTTGYKGEYLFENEILVLGRSTLYEHQQKKDYDYSFAAEIRLSSTGNPVVFIQIFASHFLPYYLDASAPNPDYQDNYRRLRAVFDFMIEKYRDLELIENLENSTPYAEMKGLEIKNLTYSDDGSLISIDMGSD